MKHSSLAILNDVTKCIGCEECVQACQKANDLPKEQPWPWVKEIDDLSSSRWTTIERVHGKDKDHFIRRQCLHCLDPSCVSACIVGALQKTPEGPVIYDRDICIGCRYCMIACPWEIPRYSWEDAVPYIQKCDMCFQRAIKQGKKPACVEACPTKATLFGDRNQLIAEAKRRLSEKPEKYIQKIWGAHEVGGTSVLYISDVDLKLTGLDEPVTDRHPLPHRTTKILHKMPHVFVSMAALMAGIYWVIDRRQKHMPESQGDVAPEAKSQRKSSQGDMPATKPTREREDK